MLNVPSPVSLAYVDTISGALKSQITSTSGVSVGTLDASGAMIMASIAGFSGYMGVPVDAYTVSIPSGVSSLQIAFSRVYTQPPPLTWSLQCDYGYMYGMNPVQITSSGYTAVFSDFIRENGVVLVTFVKP